MESESETNWPHWKRDRRTIAVKSLLKFDWSGRGSGGSTSGTRPFGQPLMLMSQESLPSTSASLRTPEIDLQAQRGANKKRWQCVALDRIASHCIASSDAFARVHQVHPRIRRILSGRIRPEDAPRRRRCCVVFLSARALSILFIRMRDPFPDFLPSALYERNVYSSDILG